MKASFLAAALIALTATATQADTSSPNRQITLVVPLPAGATADLQCRLAAEKAGAILGQQIIVENRPGGAGGRVGTETVLRAAPDGYTLLCSPQLGYSVAHLLFGKQGFDPRGLEPISVLATYPLIIVVKANLPVKTMAEFVAYAKTSPGKVSYGHQGKGQTGHLLGELMMLKGGFKMTEIPYRGSAPAINDLLAGNIDMVPDYLLANKQNIDAGKLKLLATGGHERLKDYPNAPTIAEVMPGVYADTWMGVSAPPGTPSEITHKISAAIRQGIALPEMQTRYRALEAQPLGTTPEQMRDMIKQSLDTWAPVIKDAHITID